MGHITTMSEQVSLQSIVSSSSIVTTIALVRLLPCMYADVLNESPFVHGYICTVLAMVSSSVCLVDQTMFDEFRFRRVSFIAERALELLVGGMSFHVRFQERGPGGLEVTFGTLFGFLSFVDLHVSPQVVRMVSLIIAHVTGAVLSLTLRALPLALAVGVGRFHLVRGHPGAFKLLPRSPVV